METIRDTIIGPVIFKKVVAKIVEENSQLSEEKDDLMAELIEDAKTIGQLEEQIAESETEAIKWYEKYMDERLESRKLTGENTQLKTEALEREDLLTAFKEQVRIDQEFKNLIISEIMILRKREVQEALKEYRG